MENQTLELMVKGETKFLGVKIPIITGGFGEYKKCVLAKDIALIHNTELKVINQSLKRLIDKNRITENIHYIDLLNERLKILNLQFQDAQNRMEQAASDMNAVGGAIQEVRYWIDFIQKNKNE